MYSFSCLRPGGNLTIEVIEVITRFLIFTIQFLDKRRAAAVLAEPRPIRTFDLQLFPWFSQFISRDTSNQR